MYGSPTNRRIRRPFDWCRRAHQLVARLPRGLNWGEGSADRVAVRLGRVLWVLKGFWFFPSIPLTRHPGSECTISLPATTYGNQSVQLVETASPRRTLPTSWANSRC